MTARDESILEARRRGFTQRQIAAGLNITHQAVSQRLKRYPPIDVRIKYNRAARKFPVTCMQCGKTEWLTETQRKTGHDRPRQYCSRRCMGLAARSLDEASVLWAIEMRTTGAMTWTSIASRLGYPMQTVQSRIWRYLHRQGQLKVHVVRDIWKRTTSEYNRTASWRWLEGNTGLVAR